MSWFSKAFGAVDKVANSINPFKGITDATIKATLGKISPQLGKLALWGG
jgi:hypothetical protein